MSVSLEIDGRKFVGRGASTDILEASAKAYVNALNRWKAYQSVRRGDDESMTLSEKILAAAADRERVTPGEFLEVDPDLGLANDITAPIAIQEFEKTGARACRYPERVWLVADHFTPNKDILSAQQVKQMREFSRRHPGIHFFEQGEVGVEHALLPELGAVVPGMVVVGADSHTCTYGALGAFATGMGSTDLAGFFLTGTAWLRVPPSIKVVFNGTLRPWVTGKDLILALIGTISVSGATYKALEFSGQAITSLSVEARLTMANMAIEAGAKNGVFTADDKVSAYLSSRAPGRTWKPVSRILAPSTSGSSRSMREPSSRRSPPRTSRRT